MAKTKGFLALTMVVGASLSFGCNGDDGEDDVCADEVETATDDDADFASYQTFAILDPEADTGAGGGGGMAWVPEIPDDVRLNLDAANDAAAAELEAIGLTEVDPADEQPDVWVMSAAATEAETATTWECVPGYTWWGWDYYYDPCAWLVPIQIEYTVGTMIVVLIDSSTEEPVFGGVVQGILECDTDIGARVEESVDEIFDDYPVF